MLFQPYPHAHPINHTPAIWAPRVPRNQYAVVHFRTRFTTRALKKLPLLVTASMRFIAYLDGQLIARGPSRSDPQRWHVHEIILKNLTPGPHVLAFTVLHYGPLAPYAQMGPKAFLLVRPDTNDQPLRTALTTGPHYRCYHDRSISPIKHPYWGQEKRYFVVGPSDHVDAAKHPWSWPDTNFNDRTWPAAQVIADEAQDIWGNQKLHCELRPNPLPPMTESPERFTRAIGENISWPLNIKPHTKRTILLDRGTITNAYPLLSLRGGKNARIACVWSEAPYNADGSKPQRHDALGKNFFGQQDIFLPDGPARTFTTLWFRSFRYLHLTIETKAAPLTLDEPQLRATGLPLPKPAPLAIDASHAPQIQSIDAAIYRTIQLCAHETFFDCPHFEQCQFPGDSDIQTLYHYLVLNSDTLPRKAIDDFLASRVPAGIVQCRWPTNSHVQIIPTFGLLTVSLLRDLLLYRGHAEFVRDRLAAARDTINYYERLLRPDGLLAHVPYAPFIDWSTGFTAGNPPQDPAGRSAILTLQFARTLNHLAWLETHAGMPELAPRWRTLAARLNKSVVTACWSPKHKLIADTPAKRSFSVHAQVMAILAGAVSPARGAQLLKRSLDQPHITQPGTLYFRHYVIEAFKAANLAQKFYDLLPVWSNILTKFGMNTLPESDKTPRSDCHAWGAAPAFQLLQIGLGISPDPAAPAFTRARFAPHLGPLQHLAGTIHTPHGPIHVSLQRHGQYIQAKINSPVPIRVGARTFKAGTHDLRFSH